MINPSFSGINKRESRTCFHNREGAVCVSRLIWEPLLPINKVSDKISKEKE